MAFRTGRDEVPILVVLAEPIGLDVMDGQTLRPTSAGETEVIAGPEEGRRDRAPTGAGEPKVEGRAATVLTTESRVATTQGAVLPRAVAVRFLRPDE
jgi:hypothetical protein